MNNLMITCADGTCSAHINIDRKHFSNFEGRRWSCLQHRVGRAAA